MYKDWLYYTCKWSTKGLDAVEFKAWNELTTKLDKHCPCTYCEEEYKCHSCHNTGLKLTATENMLIRTIEMCLGSNVVN
jgi:hypothetical protein